MAVSQTPQIAWKASDTEPVRCCICDLPGKKLYDLPPFGVVRCERCQLVFVSPRLKPEALQRVYDDSGYFDGRVYGAKPWSLANILQRTWTAGRLAAISAALGRDPKQGPVKLLEIGAGYGHFLADAKKRGYDVTGVELSHTASAYARDELGLTVHTSQLEEAELEPPYDVIVAWDTIEHVPDPVSFMRTVRGLLAEDGILAFSTPYISSLPGKLLGQKWWTLKPVEHIWHFTPETHAIALARAGLGLIEVVRNPLALANFGRLDSLVGLARKLPEA